MIMMSFFALDQRLIFSDDFTKKCQKKRKRLSNFREVTKKSNGPKFFKANTAK